MAARKWIKRLGVLAVMAGLCGIGGLGGYAWSQSVAQKQKNANANKGFAPGYPGTGYPGMQPVNPVQSYPANTTQMIPPNQMPGMGMGGGLPAPQQMFVPGPYGGMMTIPPGGGGSGVKWSKPEGEEPQWLVRGKQAIQAEDVVRRSLRLELEMTLADAPLSKALEEMLRPADIAYTVDAESGLQPVTIEIRGLVRDGLSRVLRPLGLDYVVRPDRLEIVEVGKSHGSVRTYNLAYVVSNSDDMERVTKMVERMVAPYAWQEQGGEGILLGIGSVLVVSTTEMVHEEVEILLAKLEAMPLRTSALSDPMGGAAAPLQTQLYRSGLAPAPGAGAQVILPGGVQPGSLVPGGGFGFTPGAMPPGGLPAAQSQSILPLSKPAPDSPPEDQNSPGGLDSALPEAAPNLELPGGQRGPSGDQRL